MPDVNEMANEPEVLMPLHASLISENMFQISIVNFINRQRVYSSDDNITAPACADERGFAWEREHNKQQRASQASQIYENANVSSRKVI